MVRRKNRRKLLKANYTLISQHFIASSNVEMYFIGTFSSERIFLSAVLLMYCNSFLVHYSLSKASFITYPKCIRVFFPKPDIQVSTVYLIFCLVSNMLYMNDRLKATAGDRYPTQKDCVYEHSTACSGTDRTSHHMWATLRGL